MRIRKWQILLSPKSKWQKFSISVLFLVIALCIAYKTLKNKSRKYWKMLKASWMSNEVVPSPSADSADSRHLDRCYPLTVDLGIPRIELRRCFYFANSVATSSELS